MSTEAKIGRTFFDVLNVIKNTVTANLNEARGQRKFDLTEQDFQTIVNLTNASIEQAGQKGITPIVRCAEEIAVVSVNTAVKTTKTRKSKPRFSTK